jgi:hypothetical protein
MLSVAAPPASTAHLSDVQLLQIVDEGASNGTASLDAHLATCGDCASRLALVTQSTRRISNLLRETSPAPLSTGEREWRRAVLLSRASRSRGARPGWRQAWRRAAAGIVLLAGVAAASSAPVRAWIAARLVPAASHAPTATSPASPNVNPKLPALSRSTVFFSIESSDLSLRLRSAQAAGELSIQRGEDPRSSAYVENGGDEEIVVLPDGLLIRNDARSTASYHILTAPNIRVVRVLLEDGALVRQINVGDGTLVRLPLAGIARPSHEPR